MVFAFLSLVMIGSASAGQTAGAETSASATITHEIAANYHLHNRSRNAFEGVPQRDRYRNLTMKRSGKHS